MISSLIFHVSFYSPEPQGKFRPNLTNQFLARGNCKGYSSLYERMTRPFFKGRLYGKNYILKSYLFLYTEPVSTKFSKKHTSKIITKQLKKHGKHLKTAFKHCERFQRSLY